MQLLALHQILIVAAIALAAIFSVRGLVGFSRDGSMAELLVAFAALTVAGGLSLYFRTVRAKWRALRRR